MKSKKSSFKIILSFLSLVIVLGVSCTSYLTQDGGESQVVVQDNTDNGQDEADSPDQTAIPLATSTLPAVIEPPHLDLTAISPDHESISDNQYCGLLLPIKAPEIEPTNQLTPSVEIPDVVPEAALPALERLIAHPETVGLAAFVIGRESDGLYWNAEVPMPLASVVKIINLIAYAEAVAAGELDPATWVPLADLEMTYLPGSDLGSHQNGIDELEARGLIGRDPLSTPLEEIPWLMIRHSSNAASDYIHLLLGQAKIEQTVLDLGLTSQTAPCPWVGQFLAISNRHRLGNDHLTVQEYIDDPSSYGDEVMELAISFAEDPVFRAYELEQNWRADMSTQRLFGANLNARGSAYDYANLMARIYQNGLSSSFVNIIVRRALEWPSNSEENQAFFNIVGYKNGSLPGILTTIYYGQRKSDGAPVVVALFYRDLPIGVYRQWRRSLTHDEFARWLMADPDAIPLMDQLLYPEYGL